MFIQLSLDVQLSMQSLLNNITENPFSKFSSYNYKSPNLAFPLKAEELTTHLSDHELSYSLWKSTFLTGKNHL